MLNLTKIRGIIFDLDGVLVDTAQYHYLAWSRLAEELGFSFSREDNERLKGVSRMQSLEILLEKGGFPGQFGDREKEELAAKKNLWYTAYIDGLTEKDILGDGKRYIQSLRAENIKIGLGSASKNAERILRHLGIYGLFDAITDGTCIEHAKPDPEVFLCCARALGLSSGECLVMEDAQAGIQAAHAAGMQCVGIGSRETLKEAELVIPSLLNAPHPGRELSCMC